MPKPKEILLEQERHELKAKSGGGILSYEVWGYDVKGKTRGNSVQTCVYQSRDIPAITVGL